MKGRYWFELGVSKKTEKANKPKKNNRKNRIEKKTRLNRLKFWNNRPVRFGFISKKPKKPNRTETEKKPEKNRAKPSQTGKTKPKPEKTEPNRFEPVFALKNQTELNRNQSVWPGFDSVSVFLKKKHFGLVTFFDKNRTEPNRKWLPLIWTLQTPSKNN